jgi:hypothetical protein
MAFRLELFASFDYFNNLCWTSLDLRRRTSRSSASLHQLGKSLT